MMSAPPSSLYACKGFLTFQLSLLFPETKGCSGFSEGSSNGFEEPTGEDTQRVLI